MLAKYYVYGETNEKHLELLLEVAEREDLCLITYEEWVVEGILSHPKVREIEDVFLLVFKDVEIIIGELFDPNEAEEATQS